MSDKKTKSNSGIAAGRGGYQPFDTKKRTYRVERKKEGFPGVGKSFSATPWGDFYWRADGLSKAIIDAQEIAELLKTGVIVQTDGPEMTVKPTELAKTA